MLVGSEEKLKNNSRDNPETKRPVGFFSLQLRNCLTKLRKDTRQQYFIFLLNLRNVYTNLS